LIGGEKIAHVRLDRVTESSNRGEIGICLAQEWRGRGIGQTILNATADYFSKLGFVSIHAEVHETNVASTHIFEQAGYKYVSTDNDGFLRYLWQE
jgi:RimJ/RimL family protein N-acetyltransferase